MITLAEVKVRLRTTETGNDTLMSTLIPEVERDAIEYANTAWQDPIVSRQGSLKFQASTGDGDKITDPDKLFNKIGFTTGMELWVNGVTSNKGKFTVAGTSSGTLTLSSSGEVLTQSSTDYHGSGTILISRINMPDAAKPYLAQMVGWRALKEEGYNPEDHDTESREGESVGFAGENEYPLRVLSGLKKYRFARVK